MGFYIQQSDLETKIPAEDFLGATDRDGDGVADPAVISDAIDAGEARIHQYLGRRYKLPLDVTDLVLFKWLKPIAVDFAWEACHPRADMVPGDLVTRNADHLKQLQDIRDGNMDPPASNPPAAASVESKISWTSEGRNFDGLP